MQENQLQQNSDNHSKELDRKPFVTVMRMVASKQWYAAYMEWSYLAESFTPTKRGMTTSKNKKKAVNEARQWALRIGVPCIL